MELPRELLDDAIDADAVSVLVNESVVGGPSDSRKAIRNGNEKSRIIWKAIRNRNKRAPRVRDETGKPLAIGAGTPGS